MASFLAVIGVIAIVFGSLGGLIACFENNITIGLAYIFSSIITGAFLLGFSKTIELLQSLIEIRDSVVDTVFPFQNRFSSGVQYRIQANRTKGKYGCQFQLQNGQPGTVNATFPSLISLINHVEKVEIPNQLKSQTQPTTASQGLIPPIQPPSFGV